VHDAAAWETVNVWPPMVSVPVRADVFGLAAALNATVPFPLPLAPLVTVNHDVLLLTPVHAHPAGDVTAVDPVPPPATTDWLVGEIANVHDAAAWVTVNVRPAMVRVPVRTEVVGLAATLYGTVPFPVPLVAPVSVIQLAFDRADQAQPAPAVTPTLPVVPPEPTDRPVEFSDGAHAAWNENPFDRELAVEPPGPIAVTRASNTTPGVGTLCNNGRKSTRMTPPLGVGFPRSMVSNATDDPTGYTDNEYRWTSGVPSLAFVLWSAEGVNST
jgi:hypothetical protein